MTSSSTGNVLFNGYIDSVLNVAALRLYDTSRLNSGAHILIDGNAARGDGNGGAYVLDLGSTAADDGQHVINTLTGKGRWLLAVGRGLQGIQGVVGPVGPPGGNITAVAARALLGTITIPLGTNIIRTSGFFADGDGGAATYQRVSANPNLGTGGVQTADGQWWQYVIDGPVGIRQFGGKQDCSSPYADFSYTGYTASWTVPSGITDNAQPLIDAYAVTTRVYPRAGKVNSAGSMIPIHIEAGPDTTTTFYMSHFPTPPGAVKIVGNNMGGDNPWTGTVIRLPANTSGPFLPLQPAQIAPATNGTVGTVIEGIWFQGGGGTDRTKHGFIPRCPHTLINCTFDSFPGDNINNVAYIGRSSTDPTYGLTSGSLWMNVTCRAAGNWNTTSNGSDNSASTFINLHHKGSRLGGLLEAGRFGNNYIGYQNNAHGDALLGSCYNNGRNYFLAIDTPGVGGSTTPGSAGSDAIWEDYGPASGPSGRFPQWVSGGDYELSVPIFVEGASIFTAPYIENYYLPACAPYGGGVNFSLIVGSYQLGSRSTPQLYVGQPGDLISTRALKTLQTVAPSDPNHAVVGDFTFVKQGVSDPGNDAGLIRQFGRGTESSGLGQGAQQVSWCEEYLGPDIRFGWARSEFGKPDITRITGQNTTRTLGRADPQPAVLELVNVALGNPGDDAASRVIRMVSTLPTSGEVARGELLFNYNPIAAASPGWVCTTGGVAGSTAVFKAMPALAA